MDRQAAGRAFTFIDVESSGLYDGSFPVEIGWAAAEPGLVAGGFLVAPHPSWDLSRGFAQDIHGIDPDMCAREGLEAETAAARLNAMFGGDTLYSDAPETDGYWLRRLFDAAGAGMAFSLEPADEVFMRLAGRGVGGLDKVELMLGLSDIVGRSYPRKHRAGPDAANLAATCLALSDPAFLARLCASGR